MVVFWLLLSTQVTVAEHAERLLSVGEDAYSMEDMILVTASGHEVLTRGIPYTASEIELALRR